jgi:hypothetical protein
MLYFGCWSKDMLGHHLYDREGRKERTDPFITSWGGTKLDSGFCETEGRYEIEGAAKLTVERGWTVLAFWDRSADDRGKSNAAFLAEGHFTFEQMVVQAKAEFPTVWKRFTFEVKLSEEKGGDVSGEQQK